MRLSLPAFPGNYARCGRQPRSCCKRASHMERRVSFALVKGTPHGLAIPGNLVGPVFRWRCRKTARIQAGKQLSNLSVFFQKPLYIWPGLMWYMK